MNDSHSGGQALMTIRDKRLYRQDYSTFEAYCQERWGMTHRRVNQLIAATETVNSLGTLVPTLPTNERQTRPLTQLPPEQQAPAWQRAVEMAGDNPVTAYPPLDTASQ